MSFWEPDPESTQGFFEDLLLLWIPELNSGQALMKIRDDIIHQTQQLLTIIFQNKSAKATALAPLQDRDKFNRASRLQKKD